MRYDLTDGHFYREREQALTELLNEGLITESRGWIKLSKLTVMER